MRFRAPVHGRASRGLGLLLVAALVASTPIVASAEDLAGFPCPGCTTVVPDARKDPAPLVVALHGDGGATKPILRAWRAAAAEAGAILLVPACPKALGCKSASYWKWLDTSGHDPAWLGAQIDAVTARFAVDPSRIYATGYSGGATYLGWYAPTFGTRFAAVAHVAGGAAYRPPCPACKLPVLFVLGKSDPMLTPYTRPLRDWYESCGGHEIVWETLPGVTHESILDVLAGGRARDILTWMLGHRACSADGGTADAGSLVIDAGGTDAGARTTAEEPAPRSPPAPAPPAGPRCSCELGETDRAASGWGILAAALVGTALARRTARARPFGIQFLLGRVDFRPEPSHGPVGVSDEPAGPSEATVEVSEAAVRSTHGSLRSSEATVPSTHEPAGPPEASVRSTHGRRRSSEAPVGPSEASVRATRGRLRAPSVACRTSLPPRLERRGTSRRAT